MRKCNTLEDTRQFLLELERLARELQASGEDIESPAISLLEKKLSKPFLRTVLTKKAEEPKDWNTSKFRTVLKEAVQREAAIKEVMQEYGLEKSPAQQKQKGEHISAVFSKLPKQKWQHKRGSKPQNNPHSASPCAFCKGEHWHSECDQFKTFGQRMAIVKEKGLCHKCLRSSHQSDQCPRPATCYNCREKHPTALCRKRKPSTSDDEHMFSVQETSTMQKLEERIKMLERQLSDKERQPTHKAQTTASAQCKAADDDKVLLMTIESTVFNPKDPSKSMRATIFIDTGAQRSFITNEAANKLGLNKLMTENCYLAGFGDREPTRYVTDRVQLGLRTPTGDKMMLSLNKVKYIVGLMPLVPIANVDTKELQRQRLNLPSQMKQPDILLGMDMFHLLCVREERTLPSGFHLCRTRLGPIISGKGQMDILDSPPDNKITFIIPLINAAAPTEENKTGSDHTSSEETRAQSKAPTSSKRVKEKSRRKPKKRDTATAAQITLQEDQQIFDGIHANWLTKTNEARRKFREKNFGVNRAPAHRPTQQPTPKRPCYKQAFANVVQDVWGGPIELQRTQEQMLQQSTSQQARMEEVMHRHERDTLQQERAQTDTKEDARCSSPPGSVASRRD